MVVPQSSQVVRSAPKARTAFMRSRSFSLCSVHLDALRMPALLSCQRALSRREHCSGLAEQSRGYNRRDGRSVRHSTLSGCNSFSVPAVARIRAVPAHVTCVFPESAERRPATSISEDWPLPTALRTQPLLGRCCVAAIRTFRQSEAGIARASSAASLSDQAQGDLLCPSR